MKNKISIALAFFMYSPFSNACSCAEIKLEDYYSNCKQLFTATLFKAKVSANDGSSIVGELRNVRDVMIGDTSKIKGLKTTMMGTSCEADLLVGKRYLVCGNDEPYISVAGCSMTTPVSWLFSQEKIEKLKLLKTNSDNSSKKTKQKDSP
jgi:hypothetical protein